MKIFIGHKTIFLAVAVILSFGMFAVSTTSSVSASNNGSGDQYYENDGDCGYGDYNDDECDDNDGGNDSDDDDEVVTIIAHKIFCDDESLLPNWGEGGPSIDADTAIDFVYENIEHCWFKQGWSFEWGDEDVTNPGDGFIGEAGNGWNTFGPTDANGKALVKIDEDDLEDTTFLWVREVLKEGFIPFSYSGENGSNSNDVSAEMYCNTDVLNYDNFERIDNLDEDGTYYCVAFNALEEESEPDPESAQCLFYGVHDESGSDSQFFTIDGDTTSIATIGGLHDGKDIEGLDVHPTTGVIYASSGGSSEKLYVVDAVTGTLTVVGDTGFDRVEALSFKDTDSTLWGWAEGEGLIEIVVATGVGALEFESETKVEGIAWNNAGTLLYAAGGNKLHVYDPSDSSFTHLASNLPGEVESLEILPNDMLIGGDHGESNLFLYDVDTLTLSSSPFNLGSFDDIEGLAWPLSCELPGEENQKPVITVLGDNPTNLTTGDTFTDGGTEALDPEDGDITLDVVVGGDTVDTNTQGTYIITYNVMDSEGLAADEVTRTVIVTDPTIVTECSDGTDNDGDELVDEDDPGCHTDGDPFNPSTYDPNDDNENSKPVIDVLGDNPLNLNVGDTFTDPGASAVDLEDGDITVNIIVGGETVDTNTPDTYTITYNVMDSEGLAALEAIRDVIVTSVSEPAVCSDGIDNDNDNLIDTLDPGCHSDGDPDNISTYDPNDDDEFDLVPYAPYCGDGEVNQVWEQCDLGEGCTSQCQFEDNNQCTDLVLARVNTESFENHANGDVSSDIFLGGVTNRIPGGIWFALHYLESYFVDPDVSGYEDVPGLAVERNANKKVRVLLHGSHGFDGSKENIEGNVEVWNTTVIGQRNDASGNNTLENWNNNITDNIPGEDEIWLVNGEDTKSFFYMTVTTADDSFFTKFDEAPICPLENQKPVITLIGDNPFNLFTGDSFTDPGATALDLEDGDITIDIVVGGETVDTNTPGTYTITYNVSDSEGLAADEVTRDVVVTDPSTNPKCSDQVDNDTDNLIDALDPACHTDGDPENPETYDPEIDSENEKPVITLLGTDPTNLVTGDSFTDPSATANDPEDGDITLDIVVGGDTVDVNTQGTYTITYNVVDSEGLAADEVTRAVTVTDPDVVTECSDGNDNDGDQLVDTLDPGCHTDGDPDNPSTYDPNDDSENQKPIITITGDSTVEVIKDNSFTDDGATADDSEDGDITGDIVVGGDTVDTSTLGTYVITYDVTDSEGLTALQVLRTVNVIDGSTPPPPPPPVCLNCGGGGGGGPVNPLRVSNEAITVVSPGTALITWTTNKPATSQVVYDTNSNVIIGATFNLSVGDSMLGYALATVETTVLTLSHSVIVNSVDLEMLHYFRPISEDNTRAIGNELSALLQEPTGGSCSLYLEEFIRFGGNNNGDQVRKLQLFLNEFEGFNLEVTGVYDIVSFNAVVTFQNKYGGDVLSPWGLEEDTGYVYLTTRKKINEIYCNGQLLFPLTAAQQAEVDAFRALLQGFRDAGQPLPDTTNVGRTDVPDAPVFVEETTNDEGEVLATEEETDEDGSNSLASAIEATEGDGESATSRIMQRIGSFFRGIFRR